MWSHWDGCETLKHRENVIFKIFKWTKYRYHSGFKMTATVLTTWHKPCSHLALGMHWDWTTFRGGAKLGPHTFSSAYMNSLWNASCSYTEEVCNHLSGNGVMWFVLISYSYVLFWFFIIFIPGRLMHCCIPLNKSNKTFGPCKQKWCRCLSAYSWGKWGSNNLSLETRFNF